MIKTFHRKINYCCSNSNNLLTDEYINQLVNKRIDHRRNRQFNEADSIKKYLNTNGIEIIDLPYIDNDETYKSTWKKKSSLLLSNEFLSLSIMELADKLIELVEENDNNSSNNKININDDKHNIITTIKELLKYQLYDKDSNISNYFDGINITTITIIVIII